MKGDVARVTHRGGCHCGAVRFEVDAPAEPEVLDCNCSMCSRRGYLHLIVDAKDFRLLEGEAVLTDYRFGTRTARHRFCSRCGIASFYVPRSHPEGFSVNRDGPRSIRKRVAKVFEKRGPGHKGLLSLPAGHLEEVYVQMAAGDLTFSGAVGEPLEKHEVLSEKG